MPRIIAMIPTYNEAENIAPLIDAILKIGPQFETLVVDDHSPDGTWKIVGELAATNPRVHLLDRTTNRGRGLAGIAGFREALRLGADWVIEMDADFSHHPRFIPDLMAATPDADLVIGSRLVAGGGEQGRPVARRWITSFASLFIRSVLGLSVRDPTSGYRVFSRRLLESMPWDAMRARGPEVVQEVLVAAHARGFKMVEVPILFEERRAGKSTFNFRIILHSFFSILRLRFSSKLKESASPKQEENDRVGGVPGMLGRFVRWPIRMWTQLLWLLITPIYFLGRILHSILYTSGILKQHRLPKPVICVGNLAFGGTGKTPFLISLAQDLISRNLKPAILSRGYKAVPPAKTARLVSDGACLLQDVVASGDEPTLIARSLPGVPVAISRLRYLGGELILKGHSPDVFLLDDGFQHDALIRDLNLVLWDVSRAEPMDSQLPGYREHPFALQKASAIILTHSEYLWNLDMRRKERQIERVTQQLKVFAPGVPIFDARTEIIGYRPFQRWKSEISASPPTYLPLTEVGANRVLPVSGLAHGGGFERMLASEGLDLTEPVRFGDHARYDQISIEKIRNAQRSMHARFVLTTEKDAVKFESLDADLSDFYAVGIRMYVTEEDRWRQFLDTELSRMNVFNGHQHD